MCIAVDFATDRAFRRTVITNGYWAFKALIFNMVGAKPLLASCALNAIFFTEPRVACWTLEDMLLT